MSHPSHPLSRRPGARRTIGGVLRRLRIDPFLVLLLLTVGVAVVLPPRGAAAGVVDGATTVAIGLLFFLYGARLSTGEVSGGLRHWRLHVTVLAATFVLFPALGLAAGLLPPWLLPAPLAAGVLFLCCLPSTLQSSIAFTSLAGGNVPAAVVAASVSNVLGVLLTPLLAALLLSTTGGFSAATLADIGLRLLAPFVAGQLARPLIGGWVRRHRRALHVVDRGAILLVVYSAFGAGVVAGTWGELTVPAVAGLVGVEAVLLAVVLVVTALGARLLRFDEADRTTILFCGSKKSLAAGLPMAGVLFAGHAVALVVLPVMLFHQLQIMVCAAIAGRLGRRRAARAAEPAAAS